MLYEHQFTSVMKESFENKLKYHRVIIFFFGNVRVTNVTK